MLLPHALKETSSYLPYRYMLGFPVEVLLGKLTPSEIYVGSLIQVAWILVVVALHSVVWRTGLRHYTAVGG